MDLGFARILLTGSEGKLGRRVAARFRQIGVQRLFLVDKKLDVDILDRDRVRSLCVQTNVTIHLAGLPHPGLATAREYLWTNVVGTLVLVEEAARAGHANFIYISSGAVYGWDLADGIVGLGRPVTEDNSVFLHHHTVDEPYTLSKIMAEQAVQLYGRTGLIKAVILRLAPIWNPGEAPSGRFLGAALSPERAVDAIVNSLSAGFEKDVSIYNIADPERCGDYSIENALRDGVVRLI